LTELFTRRYFEDYLELHYKRLLAMPDSSVHQLAIVMVDIDFFKKVNDQYGHQAGDFVLKSVGKIMKNTFRKTDLPCRYGGEEFLVILPGTGLSGAVHAADKLRQAVEKERLVFENKHIPVTVSCGVAAFHPSENYSEAIARADQALYHSKESGRNKVSYHNSSAVEIFKT
jgi:diguanylate cyclase (GGDEF)-like protein